MKTLLVTIGSHGDIHPFIAIADALRRQGHEAVIATNPYFERQIEASGTPFAALCEHSDLRQTIVEHQVMDPNRGPMNVLKKLVLPMVQETVRRTQELIRSVGADVVVYHPIVLGAPWACERAGGVPTVSISPSPTIWASRGDPLVMLPFHSTSPGRIAAAFDRFVSGLFLRTVLDPPLNRMRRELGLPPERNILWRHAREATLNLGIWSPVLRPPLPDDPTRSAIVGFTWHDRDHTQEATDVELREFLDAGPAPAVFALGSTGVHASGGVLRARGAGLRGALDPSAPRRRTRSATAREPTE
jgi:rhamnosyltransferase subunit B